MIEKIILFFTRNNIISRATKWDFVPPNFYSKPLCSFLNAKCARFSKRKRPF